MAQIETDPDALLEPREAAELLGVSTALLARWRSEKRELTPVRFGHRTVRYVRSDVDALIARRRQDG